MIHSRQFLHQKRGTATAPSSSPLLSKRAPTPIQPSGTPQTPLPQKKHPNWSIAQLQIHRPDSPTTKTNKTGLPTHLKAGIESLSGFSLDDIHIHYSSSKPAEVQALAYTQGTEIHVGPGQEKHLPHELWHVVQQKQGRVQPDALVNGVAINNDQELEHKADVMSTKASSDTILPGNLPARSSAIGTDTLVAVQRTTDYNSTVGKVIPFKGLQKAHVVSLQGKGRASWHATFYPYQSAIKNKIVFDEFHITSELEGVKIHHYYTDTGSINPRPSIGSQADYTEKSWGQANKQAVYIYKQWLNLDISKSNLDQQLEELRGANKQEVVEEEQPEYEQQWQNFLNTQIDPAFREQWQAWYDSLTAEEKPQWVTYYNQYMQQYSTPQEEVQSPAPQPATEQEALPVLTTQPATEEESTQETSANLLLNEQEEESSGSDTEKKKKKRKILTTINQ